MPYRTSPSTVRPVVVKPLPAGEKVVMSLEWARSKGSKDRSLEFIAEGVVSDNGSVSLIGAKVQAKSGFSTPQIMLRSAQDAGWDHAQQALQNLYASRKQLGALNNAAPRQVNWHSWGPALDKGSYSVGSMPASTGEGHEFRWAGGSQSHVPAAVAEAYKSATQIVSIRH